MSNAKELAARLRFVWGAVKLNELAMQAADALDRYDALERAARTIVLTQGEPYKAFAQLHPDVKLSAMEANKNAWVALRAALAALDKGATNG